MGRVCAELVSAELTQIISEFKELMADAWKT